MRKLWKKVVSTLMVTAMLVTSFAFSPVETKAAGASITSAGGYLESIYAQISGVSDADVTGVSYSGTMSGQLTGQDLEYLVRSENGGVRIDIPGLKAGTYTLTVTTKQGNLTKSNIVVSAYDRSGYAHFNYTQGVGAYNDDGTLKSNAIVLYVTDENKNTVTLSYKGITVSGIGNILNSVGKECGEAGHEGQCKKVSNGKTIYATANKNQGILEILAKDNVPLVVRFVGTVSESGLYKTTNFDANCDGLIDGLTAYNGDDYGGSVKDNGHMARMKSGKNITLEGIGTNATIDGWGFHFMCESAQPDLGKSFEVRNLTFINTPEDAIGMEGVQVSAKVTSDISASVERCWIHNNEFYCPDISSPAESDKSEGDGSVDFKRGQYFTCSYNYFEGCHKTNLVGSADTSLQYNLTYHHNYWKLCKARGPLARNANIHMYNNVFEQQTDYAMDARANSFIYSEYNLFYMCKSPQTNTSGGVIKSYHDSFSSCINDMVGVVVTDKSQKVSNNCQFSARNINYSAFETDPSLSYIPTGDYQLQESVTEARKVIGAYAGTMKAEPVTPDKVKLSELSFLPSGVKATNVTTFPTTLTPGKIEKTVAAFTVGGTVDVTVSYASDGLTTTGCLVNEAGECFLVGSGTVRELPAGTYMVQPYNFQPGEGKTLTDGTFKSITINSIEITANDPNAHYHKYTLTQTVPATCEKVGKKVYTCECGDSYEEEIKKLDHTYTWVVTKEATKEEEGLKKGTCSVCGTTTTEVIPKLGSVQTGAQSYNVTESGAAGNSFYKITANTTSVTVSYGGLSMTTGIKMESSTNISFTAASDGKLTLVFAPASSKTVKIDGTAKDIPSDGVLTVELKAGAHTITKGTTSTYLCYMSYEDAAAAPADYKAVDAALAKVPADLSKYTAETAAKVTAAVNAVVRGKTASQQAEVDKMAQDIETAVAGLALKPVEEPKPGLVKNNEDGKWYYCVNGEVVTSFTGLFHYNDVWWYIVNGVLAEDYKGIVENSAGKWYVSNGKINTSFKGLGLYEGEWYCVQAGKVNMDYTGLVLNADTWWYIRNGKLDVSYTGPLKDGAVTWFIKNGKLDVNFSGFGNNGTDFWYVTKGKVNTGYTGLVANDGAWWYVVNGKVATDYKGLVENSAGRWYVANGKVDIKFTGLAKDGTDWLCVRCGKVDMSYTGMIANGGTWWYVVDGKLASNYTGQVEFNGRTWNVKNGKLQ